MSINIKIIKSTKKQQKNRINYKEKVNTTTKGNDMKKSPSTTTKEMSNEDKEKKTGTEIIKPKIFNLSSKTLSKYQTNILLRGLKFTSTPKRNNIELKSNIQNYTRRLRLAEFFQNKEANDSKENLFQKQSTFTSPRNRDRDLDHQIDVLNNLNLEKMETKSKSNLCNMEQKELSKLSNDETIVIKPADKGGAVVILSTGHYIQKTRLLHRQQNTG